MRHRHLRPGHEDAVAAVEDVLERGSVEDWRELAARVRRNPLGKTARSLRTVLDERYMYGTTLIWRRFLADLQEGSRWRVPGVGAGLSGDDQAAQVGGQ